MRAVHVVNDYLGAYTSGDSETAASPVSEGFSLKGLMQPAVGSSLPAMEGYTQ